MDARRAEVSAGERSAAWLLLACVSLVAIAHAVLAIRHSEFLCDDMDAITWLRAIGPAAAWTVPVNIQYVPLHRLGMWVVDALFGVDHPAAVLSLLAVHGLGLALLYRLLHRLTDPGRDPATGEGRATGGPRLLPAGLLLVYAACPLLQIQFLWYSAGMHRLPYAAATFLALERWLSYRVTRAPGALAAVAFAIVVASGFYSKGPVLALHVIALELALWPLSSPPARRRSVRPLAALLLLAAGLAAVNLLMADRQATHLDVPWLALPGLALDSASLLLNALGGELRPDGPLLVPRTLGLMLGVDLLLFAVVFSVSARRSHALTWLLLGGCLLANMLVIALSARSADGLLQISLRAHRYYLEYLVIAIPFSGLALRDVRVPDAWRRPLWVAASAALVALGAHDVARVRQELELGLHYRQYTKTHAFYATLETELARIRRTYPPERRRIQDEDLPTLLSCYSVHYQHVSDMLAVRGLDATVGRPGNLVLRRDGRITDKGDDYDPDRHRKHRKQQRDKLRQLYETVNKARNQTTP